MRVACLTTIYPEVEGYLKDFLDSIGKQTNKNFDLIIVNDQFDGQIDENFNNDVETKIFSYSDTPQKNILFGLKKCYELGYDVIICSDIDDILSENRIERITSFFLNNAKVNIVFNNAVNGDFDLFFKEDIRLHDILDFNVLGYSVLNLRRELIPFVLEHENENVTTFDWWLALVYLLHFDKIHFLKDVKSFYRQHAGNYIGPANGVDPEKLRRGIFVKKCMYAELYKYCGKKGLKDAEKIFLQKKKDIDEIEDFIKSHSFNAYFELVKTYFSNNSKMFWWQDVISLDKCGKVRS